MRKGWIVHVVPGAHFDLGWAAAPAECLAYSDEIIRQAVEWLERDEKYTFVVEYTMFMKHFLESHPGYLGRVKDLVKEGRLEVCPTMTGAIEQIFDGEMLIRELAEGKNWIRRVLGVNPITAQHTDLSGHTIQMPQILKGCGIRYFTYSRVHPPIPLHRWRGIDGSEVLACCHWVTEYDDLDKRENYGWGWELFERNKGKNKIHTLLQEDLEIRDGFWPANVDDILMGCQADLYPVPLEKFNVIKELNAKKAGYELKFNTPTGFFQSVERKSLPTYSGEMPYGWYSFGALFEDIYAEGKRAEVEIEAAEKFSSVREILGLGDFPVKRLADCWDGLYYAHDHNVGGRGGEENDLERYKRCFSARVDADSVFQETSILHTVHVRYPKKVQGEPITVFNPLSWERDGLVEGFMEFPSENFPLGDVKGLRVEDPDGMDCLVQIIEKDSGRTNVRVHSDYGDGCRIYFVFLATNVPSLGYKTYYVTPLKKARSQSTDLRVSKARIENKAIKITLKDGRIGSVVWKNRNRQLVRRDEIGFNELILYEDLCHDTELVPFVSKKFTHKKFRKSIKNVQVIEKGPVRARLRITGTIEDSGFEKDIVLTARSPRIDFQTSIDWAGRWNRNLRLNFPLNLKKPTVVYGVPYATVELGDDEMENSYRHIEERYVQRWADASEKTFGVTYLTKGISNALTSQGFSAVLLRNSISCGTRHYCYEQKGVHRFHQALYPHRGDWHSAMSYRLGHEFTMPLKTSQMNGRHPISPIKEGSRRLPPSRSYFEIPAPNLVLTAFRKARDGKGFVLRLVEVEGKEGWVSIKCAFPILKALKTNLLEEPVAKLTNTKHSFKVKVDAYGIHTVRIEFK